MLAAVRDGIAAPLLWQVLGRAGNSSSQQRIDLLTRFCDLFGAERIAGLVGDREFVGNAWMRFLAGRKIPFILRLKEDGHVTFEGRRYVLSSLLQKLKPRRGRRILLGCVLGAEPDETSPSVALACKRLASGELLILATNTDAETALATNRRRWETETLFAACKTRGLNLEDTHLTCVPAWNIDPRQTNPNRTEPKKFGFG